MSKIILPVKVEQELNLQIQRSKTKRKILHTSRHLDDVLDDFGLDWAEVTITEESYELITTGLIADRIPKILDRLQKKAIPKSVWKLAIDPYTLQHKRIGEIVTVFEFIKREGAE